MADLGGTITAEATPRGRGALRVVRISGPDAFRILKNIFKPVEGKGPWDQPRRMVLGSVFDTDDRVLDEALAVCFPGPASLTGEDVLELHLHGGPGVMGGVLSALLELGARNALPGEFTYRAVLNGKMSLLKAEAVQALVEAQTSAQAARAAGGLLGNLDREIVSLRSSLLDLRALWEASMNFPEEQPVEGNRGQESLSALIDRLENLVGAARSFERKKKGLSLVLVGPVNSGKSSLFNALLGRERVIVSPHPGTTRDGVEETLEIAGAPVVLKDSAGVRPTGDPVEEVGVDLSIRSAAESDGALFVYDLSKGWDQLDEAVLNKLPKEPLFFLGNKSDICGSDPVTRQDSIVISARTGAGLETLKEALVRWIGSETSEKGTSFLSARQTACLEAALNGCLAARKALEDAFTEEYALQGLGEAQEALDELTGGGKEDLYDRIFSSFCLGK